MNLNTKPGFNSSEKAFTLSEVAMSVGIVAAVLLPILGLLATGSRLATTAQDNAAASVIASAVSGSLRYEDTQSRDPVVALGDTRQLLDSSGGNSVLASFSASGDFLEFVEEEEYASGLAGHPEALYLAAVSLKPATVPSGGIVRTHPLLQLVIEVESPARAAEGARTRLVFHSRVGAP